MTNPITRRTRVYIAGPITGSGNMLHNVHEAIGVANTLRRVGYAPYVPHLSCLWDIVHPGTYAEWLDLGKQFVLACDVLLRLPGPSRGADAEVDLARSQDIPVYFSVGDLLQNCRVQQQDRVAA